MEPWILTVAIALGCATLAGLLVHFRAAAVLVQAVTERDLLRLRVSDLEAALGEDSETAAVLRPVHDTLGRMERQVAALERDRVGQFATIRSALGRVEEEASSLGRHTASLAGSLNASSVRGAWGEVQLRRVLEHAGMLAHCDFNEQVSAVSRHAQGVRPDVVVQLPGERRLVIDAKVPMTAFLRAQAEDLPAADRTRLLGEHARALAGHVGSLAGKEYWSAFTGSPEAVVCFVPSEAMLSAALAADPALHESALSRHVVLVGPGGLLALLRSVAFTWQQDALSANAEELLGLGRELYARLGTLGAHTVKLGRSLTSAVEAYNAVVGAMESRVLVTARRMQDLGLASDLLPEQRPVTAAIRPLTAIELIDAVADAEARPELDLGLPHGSAPGETGGEGRGRSAAG
ncbi:MAG: DNA recombination protein RmuC [Tetrasphaera sp.]